MRSSLTVSDPSPATGFYWKIVLDDWTYLKTLGVSQKTYSKHYFPMGFAKMVDFPAVKRRYTDQTQDNYLRLHQTPKTAHTATSRCASLPSRVPGTTGQTVSMAYLFGKLPVACGSIRTFWSMTGVWLDPGSLCSQEWYLDPGEKRAQG